ncbi:MAG: type IVB secretion system lipoprotein DotD [Gammaproteobacteria bacterium]
MRAHPQVQLDVTTPDNQTMVDDSPLPNPPANDVASIKLAETAEVISQSLLKLAAIQATATPPVADHLPNVHAPGLSDNVSVDWSGPIAQLVLKVATIAGYKTRVLGKAPAVPILITLNVENQPLGTVLRDLDYQAGNRASIKVYPDSRVIELRYAEI